MTLKVDGTNGVLQAYDYQVLTTGFSYTFAAGTQTLIANPAGTLATGTVTMPASPVDGMVITIASTQAITALTVNANTGQSINNGGSKGLQAGGVLSYVYRLTGTTWQPFNAGLPLGVGQTWQNVTGSRSSGTVYTNSTGRPIMVSAFDTPGSNITGYGTTTGQINGVTVWYMRVDHATATDNNGTCTMLVPAGATYSITFAGVQGTVSWFEHR